MLNYPFPKLDNVVYSTIVRKTLKITFVLGYSFFTHWHLLTLPNPIKDIYKPPHTQLSTYLHNLIGIPLEPAIFLNFVFFKTSLSSNILILIHSLYRFIPYRSYPFLDQDTHIYTVQRKLNLSCIPIIRWFQTCALYLSNFSKFLVIFLKQSSSYYFNPMGPTPTLADPTNWATPLLKLTIWPWESIDN